MDHDSTGAVGLQINKPFSGLSFDTVMQNVGLHLDSDQPLYNGGPESINRIHVIHSMDWSSPTTIKLTDQLGVSNDLSVLIALSENQGPEYFRVVAGYTKWLPGHLEGEISGEGPWNISHTWTYIPSDPGIVFGMDDIDQWHQIISDGARMQVASWF